MNIYRKIYEETHGPIPHEENGRSYDIHHLDGNHENNDISNLVAVTVQDHYDIHYKQGDWAACMLILLRMDLHPTDRLELLKSFSKKRIEDGTHNFLGSQLQDKRVADGTHPFLGGTIQGITSRRRVRDRTHNFLGGEIQKITTQKRITNGTHNCLIIYTCPYCNKNGKGPVMLRHHFENCKIKRLQT